MPLVSFYTPAKHQRGVEREQWYEMGWERFFHDYSWLAMVIIVFFKYIKTWNLGDFVIRAFKDEKKFKMYTLKRGWNRGFLWL